MRHYDLEQTKDKAQGSLVSVLFMTQITELKMLLDLGAVGHRFHDFVLAMLVASIGLLIFVGILIMYIANLRHTAEPKKSTTSEKFKQCLLCRCRVTSPCSSQPKRDRRASSYSSVPIGVGVPDAIPAQSEESVKAAVEYEEEITGCCNCEFPGVKKSEGPAGDLDKLDSMIEASRVRVANAVVKLVRATNRLDEIDDLAKKNPANREMQEEARQSRAELQDAKREKEAADTEQQTAEGQRLQASLEKEQREDKEEKAVFKTVTFWQASTNYLLYFICLMNVFITAFGIYGGRSTLVHAGLTTPEIEP